MENALAVAGNPVIDPVRLDLPRPLDLAYMADLPLDVELVLDRRKASLSEIADWTEGGLLILNKAAGEPLELFVAGQLLGFGEIEVFHDSIGLRVSSMAE
jgi:flagellar motor switch protein FliN/FliY